MLLIAITLATMQPDPGGVPTPPPPPPPKIAHDALARAAIRRAEGCVGTNDVMSAAPTAVDGLRAPIGSPDWEQTRAVVRRYVQHREAARRCINDLEALRYGGHYFDPDDRAILIEAERRLLDFWLEQGDREAGILAKLVGIDTDAGHYPASLPR